MSEATRAILDKLLGILKNYAVTEEGSIISDEILDALWYAAIHNSSQKPIEPQPELRQHESAASSNANIAESPSPVEADQPSQQSNSTASKGLQLSSISQSHENETSLLQSGIPFRVPGGQALPHQLQIARSLRPLIRRVPSLHRFALDEEATADRIARSGIWLPEIKPQAVRWLELALIVENSPSMWFWHHTVREFQQLLEQQGAFSDVRVWNLKTDGKTQKISLYTQGGKTPRHYKELVSSAIRRMILIVTDGVSPAWQSLELIRWLNAWGHEHPMTLVQLLPQSLWQKTFLHSTHLLRVTMPYPAASNRFLRYRSSAPSSLEEDPNDVNDWSRRIKVPLTTLEPSYLTAWAKFISGVSDIRMPAFVLTPVQSASQTASSPMIDDDVRLRNFRSAASLTAYKLACYFAAVPLRLPIMRLVQQVMLPQSQQIHLAEFFLSGLIRRVTGDNEVTNPDEIDYDFIGDIRQSLLDAGSLSDTLKAYEMVSDYIGEHYGNVNDFSAVIVNPEIVGQIEISPELRAFAKVTAAVLNRLGGKYREAAGSLITKIPPKSSYTTSSNQTSRGEVDSDHLLVRQVGLSDYDFDGFGTHSFRVIGADGAQEFKRDASFDGQKLQTLIANARKAMSKAAWGKFEPWQKGDLYRYEGTREENLKRLRDDMIMMAAQGYRFYIEIRKRLAGVDAQTPEEIDQRVKTLEELMRKPGFMQIASKESAEHVVPVAMLYDYKFDSNLPLEKYKLCPDFVAALQASQALLETKCFQGDCASRGKLDVICPSGFWGYRHNIGLPISSSKSYYASAPQKGDYIQEPTVNLAVSTDRAFKWRKRHVERVLTLRKGLRWNYATTRDGVLQMMKEKPGHVMYFYCHSGMHPVWNVPYLLVGDPQNMQGITRDSFEAYDIKWDKIRPLIFLNCCHSPLSPEQILNLASGFVEDTHASGVIGTEITIFEPLACAFGEECLTHFFNGVPIGEAVRRARLKLLQEGNPLGLVYIPFVSPHLTLVKAT